MGKIRCWGSRGRKAGYLTKETASAEARRLVLQEERDFESYQCKWCNFFHVGSFTPDQLSIRWQPYNTALEYELGERAYQQMRLETEWGSGKRLSAIIKRWRSIMRRFNIPVHRTGWPNDKTMHS